MSKKIIILSSICVLFFVTTQFSSNSKHTSLHFTEIPADFESDICSLFPNGNYGDCCVTHDKVYFFGGTWKDRLRSDNALYSCVASKGGGHKLLAGLMWVGVRIGGAPIFPTPFRWGFGRDTQ